MKRSPQYHSKRKQAKAQRRRKRQAVPARRASKRANLQQKQAQAIDHQKRAVGLINSMELLAMLVGQAQAKKAA